MQVSIIVAHPNNTSFNHAIAQTAAEELSRRGHCAILHDLCAERFDPLMPADEIPRGAALPPDIARHCDEIAAADGIIIAHPNWWGQPPAILKGWVDRVLRPGVAYEYLESDDGDGVPIGLLKAKAALVFNTSNTPAAREMRVFGDPLEALWRTCIFDFCGVRAVYRETFRTMVTSTPQQRLDWLARVREVVQVYFP